MRATHSGTCQLCGRQQKLPNGRMAKHGYTVQWGFFEGTCPGSDGQPFELSKDLIADRITQVTEAARSQLANADRIGSDRNTVWVHEFMEYGTVRRGRRGAWVYRPMDRSKLTFKAGWVMRVEWEGRDHKPHHQDVRDDSNPYLPSSSIDEERAITLMNRQCVESIHRDVKKIEQYRDWLIERIKDWAPHPEKLVEESAEPKRALIHWYSKRWSGGKACASSAMGAHKGQATTNVSAVNCPKCIEIMKRKEVL